MTEYDYSPEAYKRQKEKNADIKRWAEGIRPDISASKARYPPEHIVPPPTAVPSCFSTSQASHRAADDLVDVHGLTSGLSHRSPRVAHGSFGLEDSATARVQTPPLIGGFYPEYAQSPVSSIASPASSPPKRKPRYDKQTDSNPPPFPVPQIDMALATPRKTLRNSKSTPRLLAASPQHHADPAPFVGTSLPGSPPPCRSANVSPSRVAPPVVHGTPINEVRSVVAPANSVVVLNTPGVLTVPDGTTVFYLNHPNTPPTHLRHPSPHSLAPSPVQSPAPSHASSANLSPLSPADKRALKKKRSFVDKIRDKMSSL
ncbi:hypothetical protein PUNSTDRAFT_52629 [Punctularia strigosozonata HHB-11173 SS5]|uniref:uncharacterized protein n=1 Tax=Punctularia strigosozonata (strain HHB-11173) TaxID=741275 RepID=UPI00044173A6|nr:uncharacterized protein PUNSTDRAFT_52629 [Punctularia strigosozonata HHB-11173 SS5]EIN08140.1 hypothetical protein PUNSTDRAFT_52629 [Punctularia strigosozonata HHB-11173 SS5]